MSTFINFQSPYGQPTQQMPQATTQALGEEGGNHYDQIIPSRQYGENGIPPQMTTMAVGEEGGNHYDQIMPSRQYGENGEPPQVTTLAVGEEGGGTVTTFAVGEEGGGTGLPIGPDPNGVSKRTEDYIGFLKKADANNNGQLTQSEAQNKVDSLKHDAKRLGTIGLFAFVVNPVIGFFMFRHQQQLEGLAKVGQRMLNNFDVFARGGPDIVNIVADTTITEAEIRRLAKRDGNANDISSADLTR